MFKIPGSGRKTSLLVEVLMIVVGINVALWFEGWFQDMQDAEMARRYIVDLREDLLKDIEGLDLAIKSGTAKSKLTDQYIELLPKIAELPPEEQAQVIFTPSNYQFFVPSDFTFRSMTATFP